MIKIYHNPNCGTSRKTLEFLKTHQIEFETILYLETPAESTRIEDSFEGHGDGVERFS
jgi:arsenate reductase